MIDKPILCSHETVERFLSDRLVETEEQAFERHLESCESCRAALKQLAAADDWWREAQDYLSDASLSSDSEGSIIGATGQTGPNETADSRWSLDFLGPTDDPRMLGRFGGYEISGVIGRGGMGIVLKGLDVALNRYVAIKLLAPHLAASGASRRRFAREAQAAAAVVHENVIAIHGVSEERGLPYLVMSYFRGTSLQKRLDADGPLATCEVLRIAMQTAAGLAAAHAQGLVHRDIKPANILLTGGVERVTITDFGLARAVDDASLTHSGVIAGTPQYMSPEQARGDAIDARSDLFSLGSVMYAMVTGRPPFRAETSYGVLRRICDSEPRPIRELAPETPKWLCRVVEKLHAKSVDDRFQSAEDVAEVLEQCLAHVQNASEPLPVWLVDERPMRKSLVGWSAAAAIAIVVVVVTLAGINSPRPESDGSKVGDEQKVSGSETRAANATDATAATGDIEWEDGTGTAIEQLRAEMLDLQTRAEQLWETVPDNSNIEE